MAEQLTPQQKQAVCDRGGKLLVSAAAGSGKTKVLVDRLLMYITDPIDPANIDDFLIITFTEAAAAELRSKIAAKLNEKIAENPGNKHLQRQIQRLYLAKISTIHSFCSGILKENTYRLDLSADFRLADDKESEELKIRTVEQVFNGAYQDNNADFYAFVDSQGLGRNDRLAPQIVLDIYEKSRCHLNPDQWLDECADAVNIDRLDDTSETVWGQFLISDLHHLLDYLIAAMGNCVDLSAQDPDLDKVTSLLLENRDVLLDIRNRKSWKEIYAAIDADFGTLRFPKNADLETKSFIVKTRDRCKKLLASKLSSFTDCNEQALLDLKQSKPAIRGLVKTVRSFAKAYEKAKRQRRVVDFSDLEHMTLDLLTGKNRDTVTATAMEIGQRFREVMVDEYQDTNLIQDRIFAALTGKRQNCFMVGDVKQSIYQFRLADPGIFLDKYNTYKPAAEALQDEGRKVLLSSNFRSGAGVIEAVNDVFSRYMSPSVGGLYYSEDEMLHEGIPHAPLSEPEVEFYAVDVEHDRYTEEAAFVAERISQLLDGNHKIREGDTLRPITPEDIVILLRAPGSVGAEYQAALMQQGIRCVREKSSDLLQTEEVSVLRSILQVISNPMQDIPLMAVAVSRIVGFSVDEIATIRADNREGCLYNAFKLSRQSSAAAFVALITKLRKAARLSTLSQLIDTVLTKTSMDVIYRSMPDGTERVDNIFAFSQLVSAFETNRQGDLDRFLEYLDHLEAGAGYAVSEDDSAGAVRIMSIHKSKGLEFPVVFVCALSKRFNDEDARAPVLCDNELGLGAYSADIQNRVKYPNIARKAIAIKTKAQSFSEEMRVLYVAMTRARDRLIMTYSRRNVEKHMEDIACRMNLMPAELMALDASSMGDWVLMSALERAEAKALPGNELFCQKYSGDQKWKIAMIAGVDPQQAVQLEKTASALPVSDAVIEDVHRRISFVYPYGSATQAPSKQTATQLKGRIKDVEISEGTQSAPKKHFRKPDFDPTATCDARAYGNAVHALMQHIRFECCLDRAGIVDELKRLVDAGFISEQHRDLIDADQITAFFSTELGRKLCASKNVLREFKFSILDDSSRYQPDVQGEQVLVQGVVDCVIIEEDGLTIIDFKTDRVTEENISSLTRQYSQQIAVYAHAMQRIYKKNVKTAALYYFRSGKFVIL